jgi:Protein of unknown function (DUF3558)
MRPRVLLGCLAATALLAGCGSSEKPAAPGSPENPLVGKTQQASEKRKAAEPGYKTLLKRQDGKPQSRFTPCGLVTRAQASAIVGEPVQLPFEAPQGPTCVYRTAKGKGLVTLAVQRAEFAKAKNNLQQAAKVDLGSRSGFCGQYGQPTLYAPLSHGRMLTVAAPCGVAKRFAARAVRSLDR